jgi:hypothetical protein
MINKCLKLNTYTPYTSYTPLNTAIFWKSLGIATIPIIYRDKRPDSKLLLNHKWEPFQKNLPTDTELAKWFSSGFHNIGVVVGWQNLVVIDFDTIPAYNKWLLWITRKPFNKILKSTLKVQTYRGVHVYLITEYPAQNAKLEGIDIKAQGGYVLTPPSIHPSGASYSVIEGKFPSRVEALSDVLPTELLISHTEYSSSEVVNINALPKFHCEDPWVAAENVFSPSEDLIYQIKKKYRIEQLLNVQIKKGRWLTTQCPFHDDQSPSFWIDIQRQLCGCFTCCMKPMDVINLYAHIHNLTVQEAIRVLAHNG